MTDSKKPIEYPSPKAGATGGFSGAEALLSIVGKGGSGVLVGVGCLPELVFLVAVGCGLFVEETGVLVGAGINVFVGAGCGVLVAAGTGVLVGAAGTGVLVAGRGVFVGSTGTGVLVGSGAAGVSVGSGGTAVGVSVKPA